MFAASFCPKLSSPPYGTVQGYRFELGATLRITCATGYELKPESSSFRTCTKTSSGAGSWSGLNPSCQCKYERHAEANVPFRLLSRLERENCTCRYP